MPKRVSTYGPSNVYRQGKQDMRRKRNIKIVRMVVLAGGIGVALFSILLILIYLQLPNVDAIASYVPNETTKIYSADGEALAELHKEENRVIIPISQMSPSIKAAVLASEDNRFYKHYGIDIKGIGRAFLTNLVARGNSQGGSTITQQLARNVFLHKKKKIVRKLAEIMLSLQLERRYTKEEILEMYLNQIYWGHNAYGIESAAQLYFSKSAKELNLPEAATLAGILRAPEMLSPFRNPQFAQWRKDLVLNRMAELGYITQEQMLSAKETPMVLATRKKLRYKAPYFTSYVVKQLVELFGDDVVFNQGLKVTTTLDWDLQQKAEEVVDKYMEEGRKPAWYKGEMLAAGLNFSQAALLSIDPRMGYIKSWVGGYDFLKAEYDHITQAQRQPGSSFKPFIYLTALESGFSPASVFDDSSVTFNTVEGPYSPTNYTKDYRGPMTMRRALELSINVIAVRILDLVGPAKVVETCRKLGIKSYLTPVMSLALGSNEVNILEMTSAYGVFANMGVKADPVSILKIEDRNGNVLFTNTVHQKNVFNANLIAALVNLMRGVVLRGTGIAAGLGERPVAGKTGTTGDYRDAWFIGFVPQLVTAAWVGNNNNSPMAGITGGSIPAQMWHDYMVYATKDLPIQYFPNPSGYINQRICSMSGGLATTFCPSEKVVEELVWSEHPVVENCTYHTNFITLGEGPARPDWEATIFPDVSKVQTLSNPVRRVRISPTQKTDEQKAPKGNFDAKKGF